MKRSLRYIAAVFSAALLAIPVPAQETAMRLRTVVIDPGHGGKDPGCVSKDQKTFEKNIALDIAKRISQKISATYPDVTVKMTRADDRFVELENRAVFANKAGADLFISVHVNSVDSGTSANGYSIHCLGQSKKKGNDLYSKNLDLVKRENSVIKLEKNYAATYQGFDPDDPQSSIIFNLMQNAHLGQSLDFAADVESAMAGGPIKNSRGVSQDPFWVLWRTAMPAVLIEVGFITNPQDLAVLRSEVGRDAIAGNIFRAFCTFKARYDREPAPVVIPEPEPEPAPVVTPEPAPATDGPRYGIQILVTSKEMPLTDPFFDGYTPIWVKAGNFYKYIVEVSADLSQVKKKYPAVWQKFPDCYIVKIQDGTTSPVH